MKEWIISIMTSLGYLGIGLLMFLENLFPPIPSELIMPLAGFTVSQGKMALVPAITAGVVGTVLGAFPWYYAGKLMGGERLRHLADRYGKWIGISGEDIEKSIAWFNQYGIQAVFLCRMVPGVRTLISIPAGISQMPLLPFVLYSTLGTLIWVGLLTYAGLALGQNYELIEHYLDPVSKIVLVILILVFIGWLVRKQWLSRRRSKNP